MRYKFCKFYTACLAIFFCRIWERRVRLKLAHKVPRGEYQHLHAYAGMHSAGKLFVVVIDPGLNHNLQVVRFGAVLHEALRPAA